MNRGDGRCEACQGGGTVVATGTPEQLAEVEASYTGRYLRRYLI